jgi:hypothetical protein
MRYIIGFLIGIGLIILLFVMIFRGGSTPAPAPNSTAKMVDYANTSTIMRLVDDYPVTADQVHHQVETIVGRDQTTLNVEQGYQGEVIRSQSYANNPTAYASFLRALQLAGYTNGSDSQDLRDERGQCATGHRYIFEIKDGNRIVQRFWSTSCGNIGSSKGKSGVIRELFRRQVPDYNKLTSGLDNLSSTLSL